MKKLFLFLSAVLAFGSHSFSQSNYYVSPNGNNANSGEATNNAWQTIPYAVNHILAGDTINIMTGTYFEKVNITVSGTSDNNITIRNYQNDQAILSGVNLPDYEYMMKIENQSHLHIIGIKFQDYQQYDAIGLLVINSSYLQILNNEFYNIDYSTTAVGETPNESQNSQPVIIFGRDAVTPATNILIDGNSIHDCETGWSEALSVNGNIDGFEISHNHIYNNTNIGIVAIGHEGECPTPELDQARNGYIRYNIVHDNPSAYAECAGIYVDGASYIYVENNQSYDNNYGIEIGCENNGNAPNDPSANHIIVRNNLIYNNTYTGIALGGYDYPTSGKVEYVSIENNSCFNDDTGNNYQGEMMISYTENSTIENNIFYTNNTDHVLFTNENEAANFSLNYNLYFSPAGSEDLVFYWNGSEYNTFSDYQAATYQDIHSAFSNPLYVNDAPTQSDLHLRANSPARNAGNPEFQETNGVDMDGEARINENRVDMGTDEYYASTASSSLHTSKEIYCFPNPSTGIFRLKLPNKETTKMYITDIWGHIVTKEMLINKNETIDIRQLANGLYFINTQTIQQKHLIKIIKE